MIKIKTTTKFKCPRCKKRSLRYSNKLNEWRCDNLECESEFQIDEIQILKICPNCSNNELLIYPQENQWICRNEECKNTYGQDYIQYVHYGLDLHLLPSVIGIPIKDYLNEEHPLSRLYRLCIAIEIVTRFLSIVGISKLILHDELGDILTYVFNQIKYSIIKPTFGTWAKIVNVVYAGLESLGKDLDLVHFVQNILLKVIGSGEGDMNIALLAVRNTISHIGLSYTSAENLISQYEPDLVSLEEEKSFIIDLWKGLKRFEKNPLIFIDKKGFGRLIGFTLEVEDFTPSTQMKTDLDKYKELLGHILLIFQEEILDLWPICAYQKPKAFKGFEEKSYSSESPMVFSRLKKASIIYSALGIELAKGEDSNNESLRKFRKIFKFEEKSEEKLDFEDDIQRDAELCIGREEEIKIAKKIIKNTRRADPKVKKNHLLWISGSPGIGKTILMAVLAREYIGGDPQHYKRLVYRFKISDPRCSREKFLQYSIKEMSDYLGKSYIKESDPKKLLQNFDFLLKEFSKFKSEHPQALPKQLLIFIDGLDEILEVDPDFINIPLNKAYKNVFWILAGRPEKKIPDLLNENTVIKIYGPKGLGTMTKKDIREMLMTDTGDFSLDLLLRDEEVEKEELKNEFIEEVLKKSNGLPLYVHYLIEEINDRNITFKDEKLLPEGLTEYYDRNLTRMAIGDLTNILTSLISIIAWVEEPVCDETILYFLIRNRCLDNTDNSIEILRKGLNAIRSMLKFKITSDGKYWFSIYHESFRTYLRESLELNISNKLILSLISKAIIDIESIPYGPTHEYISRYAAFHLLQAKDFYKQRNYIFEFKSKIEEIEIVKNASKGLINLYKNFLAEYHRHRNEIIPICEWLNDLNQYETIIEVVDNLLEILEKQCLWPILEGILEFGLTSLEKLKRTFKGLDLKNSLYNFKKSNVLYHQARYQQAIKLAEYALEIASNKGFQSLEADILWHLGHIWRFQGDKDKALSYLNEAEKLAKKIDYKTNLARIIYTKAIIEHGLGNISQAVTLYEETEVIEKSLGDKQSIGERMLDMLRIKGDLMYYEDKNELAYESWKKMEKRARDMNSDHWRRIARSRLSLVDPKIDLDSKKEAWLDSLNVNLASGETASAATSYAELAEVCIQRNEYEEAIDLCNSSEELINQSKIDNPHIRSVNAYVLVIKLISNTLLKGQGKISENDLERIKREIDKTQDLFAIWTTPYRYWVRDILKRLEID